jgi:hypothetical protein
VEGAPAEPSPTDVRSELQAAVDQQAELLAVLQAALEAVDNEIDAAADGRG